MKNKNHDIKENQSIELLKELHILTRNGEMNQDSRRKLKQVYHLYNFIEPILQELDQKNQPYTVVDHGAGKSYLGFILYDLFLKQKSIGSMIGIEFRNELVEKSMALKNKLNFTRMDFLPLSVSESKESNLISKKIELVTALHACNTATDDAIDFALQKNSDYIVLIPCCQAEVASILKNNKADFLKKTSLTEIFRHPIHTREFGSHLTNVLRCLRLESHGYQVTVTELVGFEHSMKNELIIAKKVSTKNELQKRKLNEIIEQFGLDIISHRFN